LEHRSLSDDQKQQLADLQTSIDDTLSDILNEQQRERMSRGPAGIFGGGPPGGGRGGRGGRGGGGPNGRSIFRVYRYGPDYPGLAEKDLTPGDSLVDVAKKFGQDADGEDD
jgi:hypothetical protein